MTPSSETIERALYLRLADSMRLSIQNGEWKPAEILPSTRDLATQWSVHRHTVSAALQELVSEGWLILIPRIGYKVKEDLKAPTTKQKNKVPKTFRYRWVKKPHLKPFAPSDGSIRFNFQSGLPDLREFPVQEFKSSVNEALRFEGTALLDYSHPAGWPPLIDALKEYMAHERGLKHRRLIVTNGSQEALFLTLQLLIEPGDYVAVEELSYPPVREALKMLGAKILSIPMDAEGLIPEKIARYAEKYQIRAIFVTPTHQFPTTLNLSANRRLALYDIASKHHIPIIEDDYDHEFHFTANPPPPLAALDRESLVIYTSTFSKLLFPSARLGFMAVSEEFFENFCQYRRLSTHQNDSILQDALARWIENGSLQKHLRKTRQLYLERRQAMDEALKDLVSQGKTLSWVLPDGGMALWLNTHRDSQELATKALKAGIFITPEANFRSDGKPGTHLRLGFSNQRPDEIRAGIEALGKILN